MDSISALIGTIAFALIILVQTGTIHELLSLHRGYREWRESLREAEHRRTMELLGDEPGPRAIDQGTED